MSYSPTNWTDGTTPVDASNLNKIEDALEDQDERIDANKDLISGCVSQISVTSLNDFYTKAFDFSTNRPFIVQCSANATSELTNGDNTYISVGIAYRISSDAVDYYLFGIQGLRLYGGRVVSNSIDRLYRYSYNTLITS